MMACLCFQEDFNFLQKLQQKLGPKANGAVLQVIDVGDDYFDGGDGGFELRFQFDDGA